MSMFTPSKCIVISYSGLFTAEHLHHFTVQQKSLNQHPHKNSRVEIVQKKCHNRTNKLEIKE